MSFVIKMELSALFSASWWSAGGSWCSRS